jgi:O-antigen/teichoic acid export membrane protein
MQVPIGRKLLSASVLRALNLVGAAFASLIMMPVLVHHYGDRTYGFWSLATMFIGYYSLLDAGLSGAISQHMSIAIGRANFDECRTVFNTALRIQSALGGVALLITLVISIIAPWVMKSGEDAGLFSQVLFILGIGVAVSFPARVYGGVLESELRFDIRAVLGLLSLALRTGLFVWVVLTDRGLVALAWTATLANVPELILQILLARREAAWARIGNGPLDQNETKSIISYSIYSSISYVADILRFQLDPFVITAFIGLAAVTHYRVASVFAQYYLQIIFLSVGMLWPILSRLHGRGDQERMDAVFFTGTKIACCISVFISFGLIGWGKFFIIRWMGTDYQDGYLPLIALSLAILFDVSQKPSIDLLYATFKNRVYIWINWAEGLLNLVFSCLLVRSFGIFGVALGTLAAALVVRLLLQPWLVCKTTGMNYAGYMKFFAKYLSISAALSSAAIGLSVWGLRPNYFMLSISALAATLVYTGASWMLIFDQRERQAILKSLRPQKQLSGDQTACVTAAVP